MDAFSPAKRSEIMRRVRSADTVPEMVLRSILHQLGFRFRLRPGKLPGKPDVVLPKHNTVIFMHGCFWHRHKNCPRAATPATRQKYWIPKFQRTVKRDKSNRAKLRRMGWDVITVWECELEKPEVLARKLSKLVANTASKYHIPMVEFLKAAEERAVYKVKAKRKKR